MDYKAEHKHRYLIMKGLRDRSARSSVFAFEPGEIGAPVALSVEESATAAQDLENLGLVERAAGSLVQLTDEGQRTIERALRQPLKATDLYPDMAEFVDTKKGTRSRTQISSVLTELKRLLPRLKLEDRARTELGARIDRVESELNDTATHRSSTLQGLVSIRKILETAAEGDAVVVLAELTQLIDGDVSS